MLTRPGINAQRIVRRNFQTSARSMNKVFGSPQEGVYSNLPFKIKNRKFIPFSFYFWGISGFFFFFPFMSTFLQLKKSGAFDQ